MVRSCRRIYPLLFIITQIVSPPFSLSKKYTRLIVIFWSNLGEIRMQIHSVAAAEEGKVPTQQRTSNLLDQQCQPISFRWWWFSTISVTVWCESVWQYGCCPIHWIWKCSYRKFITLLRRSIIYLEERATKFSSSNNNNNNRNKWDRRPLEHFHCQTRTTMRTHLHLVVAIQRHLLHRLVQTTTIMSTQLPLVRVTTTLGLAPYPLPFGANNNNNNNNANPSPFGAINNSDPSPFGGNSAPSPSPYGGGGNQMQQNSPTVEVEVTRERKA